MVPLRLPSCEAEICTTIRFLGWAPGSRVPSQSPTIVCVAAATGTTGIVLHPSITNIPRQILNDDEQVFSKVGTSPQNYKTSTRSHLVVNLRSRYCRRGSAIVQFSDHGQQLATQTIFGDEGVYHSQILLWEYRTSRKA